jgi:transposase-like protein
MSKKYAKRTSRSRRKAPKDLDTFQASVDRSAQAVQLSLPVAEIFEDVRSGLEQLCSTAGLLIMKSLIDDEVEGLAGKRGKHGSPALRWGHEESHVVLGGKKQALRRPRVRTRDGEEIALQRVRIFQQPALMEEEVTKQITLGVSTRDYEGAVDGLREGYGIRRSSVSRHWKSASAQTLAEFAERSLSDLDLVAIVIDGIEFHETLLIVALGVDSTGKKHVLGLWQGATESYEVAKGLLEDLIARGVDPALRYLFILDGSKALGKAVRKLFGASAEIQRCHAHKERNILSHLPKDRHQVVRMRLRAAWKMKGYEEAKSELLRLVRYLRDLNPSAARSLEEGMEETLTLHRLEIPEALRRVLRTTNMIESAFSMTRKYCRNVKRWRPGDMAARWAGTMLLEAHKRFRRLRGHRSMPRVLEILGRVVASKAASA